MSGQRRKIHVCPECGGTEFSTSVAVIQDWIVDRHGDFVKELDPCSDILHGPDDGNIWGCTKCGAEGVVAWEDGDGNIFRDDGSLWKAAGEARGGPREDDDMLEAAGDVIDNAAWEAVCACMCGEDGAEGAVINAMKALAYDPAQVGSASLDGIADAVKEAMESMRGTASANGFDVCDPKWDMAIIGETEDAIEAALGRLGIPACHPFEDDDGNICYSLGPDDRCAHCRIGHLADWEKMHGCG